MRCIFLFQFQLIISQTIKLKSIIKLYFRREIIHQTAATLILFILLNSHLYTYRTTTKIYDKYKIPIILHTLGIQIYLYMYVCIQRDDRVKSRGEPLKKPRVHRLKLPNILTASYSKLHHDCFTLYFVTVGRPSCLAQSSVVVLLLLALMLLPW